MVGVGADDDRSCYGPDSGGGLQSRGQVFGELGQGFVIFGELDRDVVDGQCQAFAFGAGDSKHEVHDV